MLMIKLNEKDDYTSYIADDGSAFVHGNANEGEECDSCLKRFVDYENCWIHDPDDGYTVCLDCVNIVPIDDMVKAYIISRKGRKR